VPYLAGGVAVAIALTVVNLLLTFGVIRRLRTHTELLSARAVPEVMVGVGESPGDFSAGAVDGEVVSRASLVGEQLVGFFSPGCGPCVEMVPRFAERAAVVGRAHAVAVVVGDAGDAAEFVAVLEPVARVVLEPGPGEGTLSGAFGVKGFPAVCVLDGEKVVTASGSSVLGVAEPTLAS
jgi:thiol-disulfide isomerase/thioredoxin